MKGIKSQSVHIVVSADTYIYVGDLKTNFKETARVLAPGGVLSFSIETLGEGVDNKGFKLLPSGRYAQSPSYVRGIARVCGLDVIKEKEIVVRKEQAADIYGMTFLCAKGERTSNS